MSCDKKNHLTTDAVPGAPRKLIANKLHKNNGGQINNIDTKGDISTETKDKIEITYKTNKKPSNESKPKKTKSKKSSSTNIFVVNSSKVHFGAVNNFNYSSANSKNKQSEEAIPHTKDIITVLGSKTIVSREHIDVVATHLGDAWREIGLELGYSCGQLDHFFEDNRAQGHKEVVYQMLLDWTQEKAEEAYLGDLATNLWNLGQRRVVQQLVALL